MRELLANYGRSEFTHWLVFGAVIGAGACGGEADAPAATVAVTASTVAAPDAPSPCDVGQLTFSAPDATAIRIRNDAPMQCEVDVFESELADPLMEPNVWLDAGAEAEVLVDQTDATCASATAITSIELVVNASRVDVPIAIPATCGVVLSAIYQVEPAG
jgi:hypothetical protein